MVGKQQMMCNTEWKESRFLEERKANEWHAEVDTVDEWLMSIGRIRTSGSLSQEEVL